MMKRISTKRRILSFVLSLCMVVTAAPVSGLAAESVTDTTAANVTKVQSYAAQMQQDNTKDDYSKGGFTWDTEKKSDSWRYFNGLMMDAFLMVGGADNIKYADAFYNSNINSDGTIKNYTTGELDSIESARGLFDLLDSENAETYKKAIQYVYTQLEDQVSYADCGGNLLHKQTSDKEPTGGWTEWNIGLDGLYMAQPFLMECANAIDEGTLTLENKDGGTVSSSDIYSTVAARFAWVYDAMYDSTTGLYNHGYNVTDETVNGHFWSRGIGWYAMALVDVIEMMPAGDQKNTLIAQLGRLFDGMLKYQDAETGMWYNVVNQNADLSGNKLETSGSSMMAYALMKAYNNDWVADKYGEAGLRAFNGVVANKVKGAEGSYSVEDTYLKSGVGDSDSYYCTNGYTTDEAKGTGALIMASTLANATAEKLPADSTDQIEPSPIPPAPDNATNTATGNLSAGTVMTYVLDTDGVDNGEKYLVVNSKSAGEAVALRNNSGSAAAQSVTISSDGQNATIADEAADSCLWTADERDSKNYKYRFQNNEQYIGLGKNSLLGTNGRNLVVTAQSGGYTLCYDNQYLTYQRGKWQRTTTTTTVYLYRQTKKEGTGESVTLTVNPASLSLKEGATSALTAAVTVGDTATETYDITWTSGDSRIATVDQNGNVTAAAEGSTVITATLTSANGMTPTDSISVSIPVTVTKEELDKTQPNWGLDAATTYPEYPADGAVRINKTATATDFNSTGVTKVELDTAGISVKKGVDVVLVADVSNSMAWSLENSGNSSDSTKLPSYGQSTKLDNAMTAAKNFSKVLLEGNTGGTADNTVSFVTFAGYDKEHSKRQSDQNTYVDSVMTVFTGESNYAAAEESFDGTSVTGAANGTSATYTLNITDNKGNTLVNGTNRGNTNYDYAFYQTQQAVQELQSQYDNYAASGRETYVVFMTDGAPSHYNKNNCNGSSDRDYFPDSSTGTYQQAYNTGNWTDYILNNKNTYATALYNQVGGNFYAFGFDLANGGFSDYTANEATLTKVLANMAEGGTIPVKATTNAAELNAFYESLANQIKRAGTEAQVTDTIKSDFTLQTKAFGTGSTPANIEVTAYDLYTKADGVDTDQIGTRKGTSTTLETVSFNADGTQAYSSLIDNGATNIMTTAADGSVTIAAKYFTYTKDAAGTEKFVWNIGDITDQEVALSYYAYLKGSMEGECAAGTYDTNESATLEYVDINGDYATKTFPVPHLNWDSAITELEYYLVNENGQPVNNAGNVIPFANRIIVGEGETRDINWNETLTVNGSGYVPAGYTMYNPAANYTVTANSDGSGNLTINDTKTIVGSTEITTKRVDTEQDNYALTKVAFGVIFKGTPEKLGSALNPDKIVMDYGKNIQVDVLANDSGYEVTTSEGDSYKIDKVVGFTQYDASADPAVQLFSPGAPAFNADYGQFTIVDGKVNFQPKKMLSAVQKIFAVVEVENKANPSDVFYMRQEIDIIPATSVYYETDFAENVFTFTNDTDKQWTTEGKTQTAGQVQNDGTIGVNQTYGFDTTYTDDATLSNGSSYMVHGQGRDKTIARFSFTGTGFDLISRTGAQQGIIRIDVYSDEARTQKVKSVTVMNKSESNLELYQIPVASIEGLELGTYYVNVGVSAEYTDEEYPSLSRGNEFYFDAIRVFNPMGNVTSTSENDAKTAYDAYAADGEANAQVSEVRNLLIDQDSYGEGILEDVPGVAFVDRETDGSHDVEIQDYKTIGPNNEVYLAKDQGIAFEISADKIPTSIDIGAKSADGNAVTLNASIASTVDEAVGTSVSSDIASCTSQYFDLMADADGVTLTDIMGTEQKAYVIIFNDADGILSITDIKVAYGDDTAAAVNYCVTAGAVQYANDVMNAGASDAEPNYDILSAQFEPATCKLRKTATLKVETTTDVKSLVVTDNKGRKVNATISSETDDAGNTVWTAAFKATVMGKRTYTVTGYSESNGSGTAGAPASAVIRVTR